MIGYNENPEATAAAIDSDGWLHTGDLGTMDAQGFVRVTGRVKDMIIRGGENHFPAEIEAAVGDPQACGTSRRSRLTGREMGRGDRGIHPVRPAA